MLEELQEAAHNAQAAREREALLLQMLKDATAMTASSTCPAVPHRLPRSTTPASGRTSCSPWRVTPGAPCVRRIVALLQDYPDGLNPAEIRDCSGGVDR